MEKKEFKKIAKSFFKEKGFQFNGNNGFKLIDDEYMIGITLDHNPYFKSYFIEYGVVFLPDESKFPFKGYFDWNDRFVFSKDLPIDFNKIQIEEGRYYETKLSDSFEYFDRTKDDLLNQLALNNDLKINVLLDKKYVLKYYEENIDLLSVLPNSTIEKLLNYHNFDRNEINRYRRQWGYDKYDF